MIYPDLTGTPWRWIVLRERDDTRCLVDADDYAWLSERKWNVWWSGRRGSWQLYAKRNIGPDRATVKMHREILRRADPREEREIAKLLGDHANRQTLDNRKANLRWIDAAGNSGNRGDRALIPALDAIARDLLAQWRSEKGAEAVRALAEDDLAATF